MTDSPVTRATLLLRLRDPEDAEAWTEFLQDYGPMVYRFLRRRGLQDADAADLVQDVLRSVGMAIDRLDYDKDKGGFRAWLFTIARNKLYTFFEKQGRRGPTGNNTDQWEQLNQASDDHDELDQQWEQEHQRTLADRAMRKLREETDPKTWAAFEMTAVEDLPAAEVAERLAMSKGAVYVAKSRVIARLRSEIETLMTEEN